MINGHDGSNWSDIISDFMDYTEGAVSPEIHRLWCGISLVGGACERRIWTTVGDYIDFPNLYILLVAPPGTGKSIINTVKDLWQEAVNPETKSSLFHVASESLTRAALVDELKDAETVRLIKMFAYEYHTLLIAAEEFEVILPSYDSNLISLLNALWNNGKSHTEKRRHGPAKEVIIERPQLHILGGAQPSYFVAHFPEEAWTTGLARRTIMVYADSAPTKDPFIKTPNRRTIKDRILKRLANLFEMYGEVRIQKSVAEKVTKWHLSKQPPRPTHSKLEGYVTTRLQFLLKLCTISCMSRSLDMLIEDMDLDRAMKWLLQAESYMPDIHRAMVGRSDTQVLEELHRYTFACWTKDKRAIKTSTIIEFLATRLPSEKVDKVFQVAERSGLISREPNTVDSWRPRHNLRLIQGD